MNSSLKTEDLHTTIETFNRRLDITEFHSNLRRTSIQITDRIMSQAMKSAYSTRAEVPTALFRGVVAGDSLYLIPCIETDPEFTLNTPDISPVSATSSLSSEDIWNRHESSLRPCSATSSGAMTKAEPRVKIHDTTLSQDRRRHGWIEHH